LILVIIIILISVAFLTLIERKLLGYIQIRKGPNKLGFKGLLQPFSDAIKLLSKEDFKLLKLNFLYYYFSPVFILVLILIIWVIYPFYTNLIIIKFGLIYIICCLGLGGYGLLIRGWSSNSSYAILGSLRSLSQSISYEVRLRIIIFSSILLIERFKLNNFIILQSIIYTYCYIWPIRIVFFFRIIAELNRTPFDFSEGESELVSGFNVEYRRGGFTLIFLSEYSSIIFIRFLYRILYIGFIFIDLFFYLNILSIIYFILFIRGCVPRFRYDLLIYLCWIVILPSSLNYLLFIVWFKLIYFVI